MTKLLVSLSFHLVSTWIGCWAKCTHLIAPLRLQRCGSKMAEKSRMTRLNTVQRSNLWHFFALRHIFFCCYGCAFYNDATFWSSQEFFIPGTAGEWRWSTLTQGHRFNGIVSNCLQAPAQPSPLLQAGRDFFAYYEWSTQLNPHSKSSVWWGKGTMNLGKGLPIPFGQCPQLYILILGMGSPKLWCFKNLYNLMWFHKNG